MTATDQDEAAERAIAWLAGEARKICPPSLLADPVRWATARITELRNEYWRCMPPDPKLTRAVGGGGGVPPEAHADELEAVRRRCETASGMHRSRQTTEAAKAAITRKDPDA